MRRAWLETGDMETFHRLRALLEHNDLLLEAGAMGGSMAGLAHVYGFRSPGAGRLWVEAAKLELIEQVLERHGIAIASPGQPIVDRSEPICPACGAELTPEADDAVCPSCDTAFEWVDIESSGDSEAENDPAAANNDGFRLVGISLDVVAATLALTIIIMIGQRIYSAAVFFGVILAFVAVVRLPVWLRYARSAGSEQDSPDA